MQQEPYLLASWPRAHEDPLQQEEGRAHCVLLRQLQCVWVTCWAWHQLLLLLPCAYQGYPGQSCPGPAG